MPAGASPPATQGWPPGAAAPIPPRDVDPAPPLGYGRTPTLAELAKGTLAVTVFQNARGQAKGAVDAAVTLARGGRIDRFVWIPFELVTRDNYKTFLDR